VKNPQALWANVAVVMVGLGRFAALRRTHQLSTNDGLFRRPPSTNTGSRRGGAQRLNAAQMCVRPGTHWGQQPFSAAGRNAAGSAIVMNHQVKERQRTAKERIV